MPDDRHELARVLTLKDATMLVVSSVIGVGIFFTPGGVAKLLPSAGWFFAAWVVGGVLALAGALANAELGAMFPKAGGNYVYLTAAYHPMAGFLVGWLSFFAIFAGTVATLAVGFADGLAPFVHLGKAAKIAVAVGAIVVTSLANLAATRAGATLNTVTGYVKIAALVALVAIAPFVAHVHVPAPFASAGAPTFSDFGVALSPVIFSYLGWNASVYVAGEIEHPDKNLPRSLFIGLAICTAIYLLVTGTYVYALGMSKLAATNEVGSAVASALFGASGRAIMAAMVVASIFGCLNANVLIGPRIAFAMAKDGLFFRSAGQLSARGTPALAIVVQAAVAIGLVLLLDKLPRVLDYTTFAIVLATIADTSALYVLRVKQPGARRPYRAAGYPIVPLLYIGANVAVAISMVAARPVECVTSLFVLAAGVPVYWLFARRRAA